MSITRAPNKATWKFLTSDLPYRFSRSPKLVKKAIMADIKDLMQDLWRTTDDGAIRAAFLGMRRLLEILQSCIRLLDVCFDIVSFFATAADKNVQSGHWYNSTLSPDLQVDVRIQAKFKRLFYRYRKMFDHSLSKSKDLSDMLRLLPGVVVQKEMSKQGMVGLYRIKPDLLESLIESSIEPLRPRYFSGYSLDDYLCGFLQERDRCQLYYCDPMLQQISICRQFFSLLDGSKAFDLHS